jgi:hypothetical protein
MPLRIGTLTPSKLYLGSTEVTKAYLGAVEVYFALDPDAAAYIAAVEAADTQALEDGVIAAINGFVVGCKADGIWAAIKASCIMAGARTLTGALVPLVGTAPTNFNFVSGDYNRKTGLVGNGSTKYLDSNRNNNADPQDNNHNAVFINTLSGGAQVYLGAGITQSGVNALQISATFNIVTRSRNAGSGPGNSAATHVAGLYAHSRAASTGYTTRIGGVNYTNNQASEASFNGNILVFARGTTSAQQNFSNGRLAFYSIGESINLAQLDSRVSTLITAIDAAIP